MLGLLKCLRSVAGIVFICITVKASDSALIHRFYIILLIFKGQNSIIMLVILHLVLLPVNAENRLVEFNLNCNYSQ